jgi:CDP-glycerol glycerophosphotransferase (TagB/SpsB family)
MEMYKKIYKNSKVIIKIFSMLLAFIYVNVINRKILKKNFWIISEKQTEARDNGYHLFKYIVSNKLRMNVAYVISKSSKEKYKVEKLGEVINYDSFKHQCYYIAAKCRICGQAYGVQPYVGVISNQRLRVFCRKDQKHIHIRHGIAKDYMPEAHDYKFNGYDLFICGAKKEYEYIKSTYEYPDDKIALTGFCRFDELLNFKKENIILIMPTFRTWLKVDDSRKENANEIEAKTFVSSNYYKKYLELLTNPILENILIDNKYKIVFYLHYTFQPYSYLFKSVINNDNIIIADRYNYDVQNLLKRASLLITDYSSIYFDFGYMYKPLLYYQFDNNEYRTKHYKKGYFSYDLDGFGPIFTTSKEVIEYIIKMVDNDFCIEKKYIDRINEYFYLRDNKNCERVYKEIERVEKL